MEIYEQGSSSGITLQKHMLKTFTWMFFGVLITFITAFLISQNESLVYYYLYNYRMLHIIMFVAQLGMVVVLASRILKLSATTAKLIFVAYSIITGITFSVIGYVYTSESIATAFGIASVFFGSLVVIGYTTKMDLSKIGYICIVGFWALFAWGAITLLFNLDLNIFIYSIIGLVIFVGITAWDVQKMKKIYYAYEGDDSALSNLAIYSALQLYIDFINIFIYILNIVGKGRD